MNWTTKALVALLVLVLVAVATECVRVGLSEYRSLSGWPQRLVAPTDEAGLQSSPVSWHSASGRVAAWYWEGRNGAGVVLVHGSGSNRNDLSDEMFLLGHAGFSVLAIDLPGHGESEGVVDYSGQNRKAISEAVAFLLNSGNVNSVGLFGFSLGGYQAVQVAASNPDVRALAVAGTPGSMIDHACSEYPRLCKFSLAPVLTAMRLRGLYPEDTPALQAIRELHGRPLLVIQGADDPAVPEPLARALFNAANQPKEYLLLPGQGHGGYGRGAPNEYSSHLIGFFQRTLCKPEGPAVTE